MKPLVFLLAFAPLVGGEASDVPVATPGLGHHPQNVIPAVVEAAPAALGFDVMGLHVEDELPLSQDVLGTAKLPPTLSKRAKASFIAKKLAAAPVGTGVRQSLRGRCLRRKGNRREFPVGGAVELDGKAPAFRVQLMASNSHASQHPQPESG